MGGEAGKKPEKSQRKKAINRDYRSGCASHSILKDMIKIEIDSHIFITETHVKPDDKVP